MKLYRMIVFACFWLFVAKPGFAQTKIEGIAAVVDRQIILYSEVFSLAEQEAAARKIDMNTEPEIFIEILKKWLDSLIDNKVQLVKAEEDSTVVVFNEFVEEQVNEQIQSEIRIRGSEKAVEQLWNITMPELRDLLTKQTREQMLIQKLMQVVTQDVTVSRSEIELFYETYKDSLPPIPTLYDLSHILVIPSKSTEVVAEKKAIMESIRQDIINGADFAELAKNYSEDPISASKGGDLDWQEPGTFVAVFDSVITQLEPGEVSDIVQSRFGFHIIQLLERDGERFHSRHILKLLVPTEDDVKKNIEDINRYRESALNGEDFDELALKYSDDPEVKTTKGHMGEWDLTRLERVLPEFKPVVEDLKEDEISEPFRSQFGIHIVKLNKIIEEHPRALEQDYEYIRDLATENKKNKYYLQWFKNAKKEVYIEIKLRFDDTANSINNTSEKKESQFNP